MHHVILASGDGSLVPRVDEIERQRRLHWNRRMQRRRRLPCTVADAGDVLTITSGRLQRQRTAVARDDEAVGSEPGGHDLQTFDRRVDVTHCTTTHALFAEDVPGFERLPQG